MTLLCRHLKLALAGSGEFVNTMGSGSCPIQGENLSSDLEAPDPFKNKLLKMKGLHWL